MMFTQVYGEETMAIRGKGSRDYENCIVFTFLFYIAFASFLVFILFFIFIYNFTLYKMK